MQYINLVSGDKLYKIKFHLTNDDEVSINLTDAVVLFNATQEGSDSISVSGNCEEIDETYPPVSGYTAFTVQSGNFISAGLYNAELQITLNSGMGTEEVITAPNLRLLVQDQLWLILEK